MGSIENFDPFAILQASRRPARPCCGGCAAVGRCPSWLAMGWGCRCPMLCALQWSPQPRSSLPIALPIFSPTRGLQVPVDASEGEIKKAYRKLSLQVRKSAAALTGMYVESVLAADKCVVVSRPPARTGLQRLAGGSCVAAWQPAGTCFPGHRTCSTTPTRTPTPRPTPTLPPTLPRQAEPLTNAAFGERRARLALRACGLPLPRGLSCRVRFEAPLDTSRPQQLDPAVVIPAPKMCAQPEGPSLGLFLLHVALFPAPAPSVYCLCTCAGCAGVQGAH